jgi:hypothetical protein
LVAVATDSSHPTQASLASFTVPTARKRRSFGTQVCYLSQFTPAVLDCHAPAHFCPADKPAELHQTSSRNRRQPQLARLLRPIAATYFQTLFWHGGRKQVSTSIRSCLVHVSCRFECTHIPSTNPLSPVLSARFWVPASSTPQPHSRFTLRLRSRTLYLFSACIYPSNSLSSLYGKDERAGLCSP